MKFSEYEDRFFNFVLLVLIFFPELKFFVEGMIVMYAAIKWHGAFQEPQDTYNS